MTLTVSPLISSLADRFNCRVIILRYALIATALAYFLLGLPSVTTFTALLPLMTLYAVTYSPLVSLADTTITRMARHHGLNYGNLRLWGSLVFATTTIAFGLVWQQFPYRWMFLITAVLQLPVILITTQLEDESKQTRPSARQSLWQIFQIPHIPTVLLATFLTGIGLGLIFIFDGIYMSYLGGSGLFVGLMFGIAAFAELPSMQFTQALSQRFDERAVFSTGLVLLILSMIGYILAPSPAVLLLFAAIRGAGFGLFFISGVRLIDQLAPAEWISTAQSLRQAGTFGLALLIASPLGGWIYDMGNPRLIFVFAAGAFLLAAAAVISLKSSK